MKFHFAKAIVASALGALMIALPAHADDTHVAPVEEAWAVAQEQYSQGRYGDAFGNFYWAAIRNHAQAQEIVGMMYLLGPAVYGPAIRADRAEAAFWLGEAGKRGRDVGRHMHCAMAQAAKPAALAEQAQTCLAR